MDLLIRPMRAAYRRNPVFFVAFMVLSAIVGIAVGYRLLGPAIFG